MSDTFPVEMRKVIHISIDCERNDPVDIRCGGPAYLGFDFYVAEGEGARPYLTHIRKCLKRYGRPMIGTQCRHITREADAKVWTREDIEASIQKGY
jgi:hypothetical protein